MSEGSRQRRRDPDEEEVMRGLKGAGAGMGAEGPR